MSQSENTTTLSTRDALLEATLRVIAKEGMRAVTHRKVAAEAGVSLSATSYHLSNIQNILYESMERYVTLARDRYEPSSRSCSTSTATRTTSC
jgi:DNA-binding transcriptional regulator YbjK